MSDNDKIGNVLKDIMRRLKETESPEILDYYRLSPDRRLLYGGRCNYSGRDPADIRYTVLMPTMVTDDKAAVDAFISGRRLGDGPLHELTPEAYEATMRLNATTHVTVTASPAATPV